MKKSRNNKSRICILLVFIIALAVGAWFIIKGKGSSETPASQPQPKVNDSVMVEVQDPVVDTAEAAFIVIDKQTMTLKLYDIKGHQLMNVDIACGRNYGNKQVPGDLRTPEGVFSVQAIQDASGWTHDFNDGKGEIEGAYGHWFIRLSCPGHSGIGIHGTHDPNSIGTRCTEGCIRLHNENLEKLKAHVYPGMVVIILPSNRDVAENNAHSKP